MADYVDAVISLCDKIEALDLTDAEQTVLRTLVDIALERTDSPDGPDGNDRAEVAGFAFAAGDPVGLRESIGNLALARPGPFERRRAFDRKLPPGSSYQAMPELDANGT